MATTSNYQGRPGPSRGGYAGGRGNAGATEESVRIDLSDVKLANPVPAKLFSDIAERIAKDVSPSSGQKNKPSQIRRFYDEFLLLQQRVGKSEEQFRQQEPFIQMLKAKVAYAKGRDKVDGAFEAVLKHVVDNSSDPATLLNGKYFLEAFMAFYKVYGPKD